jgi:hypothetical protein
MLRLRVDNNDYGARVQSCDNFHLRRLWGETRDSINSTNPPMTFGGWRHLHTPREGSVPVEKMPAIQYSREYPCKVELYLTFDAKRGRISLMKNNSLQVLWWHRGIAGHSLQLGAMPALNIVSGGWNDRMDGV